MPEVDLAEPVRTGVLGRGLGLIWRAIREQPRIFAVALLGSAGFGGLTVASAFVVGEVVGRIVVPAFDTGRVAPAALALGAAAIIGLSLLKVCAIYGRRLGAGTMQFRLQAEYRRRVTRRYLELPPAWHRKHATGTLLSNANADVEALWFPIAPMPFAVGTIIMLVVAIVGLFAVDWTFALVGLAIFPALFGLNVIYSRADVAADLGGPGPSGAHQRDRARELRRRPGGQDHGPRAGRDRAVPGRGEQAPRRDDPGRPAAWPVRPAARCIAQPGQPRRARSRRRPDAAGRGDRGRGLRRRVPLHRARVPGSGDRLGAHRASAQCGRLGAGEPGAHRDR